ncbi:MAG: esterase-like activity of phytase family protein [bacterium]|nr:esterase-like activity of phytase family protein [bacterium]
MADSTYDRVRLRLCVLLLAATCHCATSRDSPAPPPSVAQQERIAIEAQDVRGISGLARAPDGALWAVGERDRVLLKLSAADGVTLSRRTIEGVDRGVDLESLARLSETSIAAGTESREHGRAVDLIYFVELGTDDARVTHHIVFPYSLWGVSPKRNEGVEGLCHADSILLAGIETVVERDGDRLAAVGRYDVDAETWTPFWLRLTSPAGKLSALDCRTDGDELEVLAVERHFGVTRVLRFSVPRRGAIDVVVPTVALDLTPNILPTDNFEGVVRVGDDSAMLVLDNQFGSITGPNVLVRVSF